MKSVDTLIIGTGCAGYNTADRLYDLGLRDIALLTEGRTLGTSRNTGSDKQTYYKLTLSGAAGDSVRELAETLYSGGGVMGEHALAEAAYSVRSFMHLVELGVPFPVNEFGEFPGYKTDHDPRMRATSAGPLTSKYMTEALERSVRAKGVELLDGLLAVRILTDAGGVNGVAAVDVNTGELSVIACSNVVLCTGGPAGIYENTVYPESQHGATGLAIEAGAWLSNLEEWQYGIASTDFRWNLSGTYQQVLPRYVSADEDGNETEFLWDALGAASLGLVFLKGYQWPFDTRKVGGSSQIDLLVADELKRGRTVWLDYTRNPKGLERGFDVLPAEAYEYLKRSDALFGTPLERLEKMNPGAIELYLNHGIDLAHDRLRIAVCAQHCNGGVKVDGHWQTDVEGLYAAGEAAGTFGVYRPGGSALNSTQVGSLRAAEHIAATGRVRHSEPVFALPDVRRGESNLKVLGDALRAGMSRAADFDRNTAQMRKLLAEVSGLCDAFFDTAHIQDGSELAELYKLRDAYLTARSVLSAMLLSAETLGTHGSAFVDRGPNTTGDSPRTTYTATFGAHSELRPVTPMPDPELWFEKLLSAAHNKKR